MATLKPLWLSLGSIGSRLAESRTLYLACDYDGTLTPIVDQPDIARLSQRSRQLVERLAGRNDVQVGIFSGRRMDDLARHVGVGGLFLAGSSGLETQGADGRREVHVGPDRALPAALREQLDAWCERFPGSWIEDKQVSLALHYRAVAPDLQPAFGAGVRRRIRPFKSQARLVHGKRVFEVMPAVEWDKSSSLRHWLGEGPLDGTLLYFGDDTNDEPVYDAVRGYGGIAVAVGRTVSRAEFVLPSAQEVQWFLEWLEREWDTRPVPIGAAGARQLQNA
jgi:trehalose-phosphatase